MRLLTFCTAPAALFDRGTWDAPPTGYSPRPFRQTEHAAPLQAAPRHTAGDSAPRDRLPPGTAVCKLAHCPRDDRGKPTRNAGKVSSRHAMTPRAIMRPVLLPTGKPCTRVYITIVAYIPVTAAGAYIFFYLHWMHNIICSHFFRVCIIGHNRTSFYI